MNLTVRLMKIAPDISAIPSWDFSASILVADSGRMFFLNLLPQGARIICAHLRRSLGNVRILGIVSRPASARPSFPAPAPVTTALYPGG